MATKAGGRLTFSGRQEYQAVPLYRHSATHEPVIIGYAAICPCELGHHYLALDTTGQIIEATVTPGGTPYLFPAYADAQAAIEAWQRQHDAAQAASGESEG